MRLRERRAASLRSQRFLAQTFGSSWCLQWFWCKLLNWSCAATMTGMPARQRTPELFKGLHFDHEVVIAFMLPIPVLYDLPTVILSLFAAVFASAVALFVVSRQAV